MLASHLITEFTEKNQCCYIHVCQKLYIVYTCTCIHTNIVYMYMYTHQHCIHVYVHVHVYIHHNLETIISGFIPIWCFLKTAIKLVHLSKLVHFLIMSSKVSILYIHVHVHVQYIIISICPEHNIQHIIIQYHTCPELQKDARSPRQRRRL